MQVSDLEEGTLFTESSAPGYIWELCTFNDNTALCRRVLMLSGGKWLVARTGYYEQMNLYQDVSLVSITSV